MTMVKQGLGIGHDWRSATRAALQALGELPDDPPPMLGFLYINQLLAADAPSILMLVKSLTRCPLWVGCCGSAIIYGNMDIGDQPAIALALMPINSQDALLVPKLAKPRPEALQFASQHQGAALITHASPTDAAVLDSLLEWRGRDVYPWGAVAAGDTHFPIFAGDCYDPGIGGVLLAPRIPFRSFLAQGCVPIGAAHHVTRAELGLLHQLDGKPAFAVMKEDLAAYSIKTGQLIKSRGQIHIGVIPAGDDTGQYQVRHLGGLDPHDGSLSVNYDPQDGDHIVFVQRDPISAKAELLKIARRAITLRPEAKLAIFISCLARGRHMFTEQASEVRLLKEELGDIPLLGCYANGEIAGGEIYGYTGLLALIG